MKKNISVVMPVYNAENTIAECIKSVLRSLQDSDELIIVDDGSADAVYVADVGQNQIWSCA